MSAQCFIRRLLWFITDFQCNVIILSQKNGERKSFFSLWAPSNMLDHWSSHRSFARFFFLHHNHLNTSDRNDWWIMTMEYETRTFATIELNEITMPSLLSKRMRYGPVLSLWSCVHVVRLLLCLRSSNILIFLQFNTKRNWIPSATTNAMK